jgi:hypothetical protein
MRTIKTHHTNECNRAITIDADDPDPENGNASHEYTVHWHNLDERSVSYSNVIEFQHGPIKEAGINGLTNEVLLAIVIDRLEGFQSSKFACGENARALASCHEALFQLTERTRNREARGVEGTHTP